MQDGVSVPSLFMKVVINQPRLGAGGPPDLPFRGHGYSGSVWHGLNKDAAAAGISGNGDRVNGRWYA